MPENVFLSSSLSNANLFSMFLFKSSIALCVSFTVSAIFEGSASALAFSAAAFNASAFIFASLANCLNLSNS